LFYIVIKQNKAEVAQEGHTNILNTGDEANIALLLSPEKFHSYLLNSMNIRADEALSNYFFGQIKENESEDVSLIFRLTLFY